MNRNDFRPIAVPAAFVRTEGECLLKPVLRAFVADLMCLLVFVMVSSTANAVELIAPPRNTEAALGNGLDHPLLVYSRDSTLACFSDYVPTREEVDAQPTIRLASNEYEPLQLGLYVPSTSADALKGITIEVRCELPHQIGHLYYEPNARRRMLDHGRPYDYRRPHMPLYVIPEGMITEIQPGHSAAFWVTFGNRDGVKPGDYTASISIRAEGVDTVERTVNVHVRPFALPRPLPAFGCYYRIDRIPVYFDRKYQEMYVRDQAEHGHNCTQIISYFSAFGLDDYQADGKVPIQTGRAFRVIYREEDDLREFV